MWYVYILECGDSTLYTGITNNLQNRLEAHQSGKGAKYTKGRGPLRMVYSEECMSRSTASKRECEIKALSRVDKQKLFS